ncbi:hypothetical protein [Streptomyces sp. ICBB 8177]|uniref:hypothetical protein n=1 Tax=Streptomyces sp. ICBB 8177 TaxID=563922 RepID=UPI0018EEC4A6|nr:hypothetical protein [Streptomyces sp. ICBB 8177]
MAASVPEAPASFSEVAAPFPEAFAAADPVGVPFGGVAEGTSVRAASHTTSPDGIGSLR